MTSPEQPSLFDEANAGRHDYGGELDTHDAGHEYPFVVAGSEHAKSEVADGVAVNLAHRAAALIDIMEFYALDNQARGFSKQRRHPKSMVNQRYGSKAPKVEAEMFRKRREQLKKYHDGMKVLYPADEMVEAGLMEEADADINFTSFKHLMNEIYSGTGKDAQRWRHEVTGKIKTSTDAMEISVPRKD